MDFRNLTRRSLCLLLPAWLLASCGGGGAPITSLPSHGGTQYQPAFGSPAYSQPPPVWPQQSPAPVPVAPAVSDPYYVSPRPLPIASGAPPIHAASYVLIDATTGANLASRNCDQRRAVASIQKLVTALVVLDSGNLSRRVEIASTDIAVEPSKLGVRPGESYTRKDLLYAFLIKSSNDVAKALARDNAGSSAAFAERMNGKMRQLGAMNSNFVNPHGLTEPGQYSTARDMARVARAAYRNSLIRDATSRKYHTFHFNSGRTTQLKNTNNLLGVMPACNGMKTGYTVASGRTLISSATSGGRHVILVQLGSKTNWIFDDARTMMAWGLRQLGARSVVMEAGDESDNAAAPMLAATE